MAARAGEFVEVRSKEEILRTLDKSGRLTASFHAANVLLPRPALPGSKSRVQDVRYCQRALPRTATVRCGASQCRCDGQAHGGVKRLLIFWKSAWLKPIDGPAATKAPARGYGVPMTHLSKTAVRMATSEERPHYGPVTVERDILPGNRAAELHPQLNGGMPDSTWKPTAQATGRCPEVCRGLFYLFYYYATLAFSDRWGRPARWLYNHVQATTGAFRFLEKKKIPVGQSRPEETSIFSLVIWRA